MELILWHLMMINSSAINRHLSNYLQVLLSLSTNIFRIDGWRRERTDEVFYLSFAATTTTTCVCGVKGPPGKVGGGIVAREQIELEMRVSVGGSKMKNN